MGTTESVRQDINTLMSRNFGTEVGNFFSNANEEDTLPIFLHNSFIILKELLGEAKAREQLNMILNRHNIMQKYD